MFSHRSARAFYDRFGSKQDWQRFYEDRALGELIAHADFEHAQRVFEFGCGTGRLAELLLEQHLPESATYLGIDLSSTMVGLASDRLARFGSRARVHLSDGQTRLEFEAGGFDCFLSTYVLDLLSVTDIQDVVAEAHRLLALDGELELASLTHGDTLGARWIAKIIAFLRRVRPSLTGGCRPLDLETYLPRSDWDIVFSGKITRFGITSQVVVARKLVI